MTEIHDAPIPFPADRHHAALVARLAALRRELDAETAARGHAETELGDARELARDLRRRVEGLEAESRALWRLLGQRLLQATWPFVLAGLVGGFACVALIRWAGW